jgi:hypothetical protein
MPLFLGCLRSDHRKHLRDEALFSTYREYLTGKTLLWSMRLTAVRPRRSSQGGALIALHRQGATVCCRVKS